MFWRDLQAVFRESFVTYAAHVSTYLLEFLEVIKLYSAYVIEDSLKMAKSGRNMLEN